MTNVTYYQANIYKQHKLSYALCFDVKMWSEIYKETVN